MHEVLKSYFLAFFFSFLFASKWVMFGQEKMLYTTLLFYFYDLVRYKLTFKLNIVEEKKKILRLSYFGYSY